MIEPDQIIAVISWLSLLFFIHISVYPLVRKFLPSVAVPLSWSAGFFILSFSSWYATYLGFPLITGMIPLIAILCYCGIIYRKNAFKGFIAGWNYYLLFFIVFATMLIVRMYNPDINGAEKFMDHAFLASIIHTPMVPPLDPWFAGERLGVYYYFGHWMIASSGFIAGIPSAILFNLALPTIAALSSINIYGCGVLLLKKSRLLPVLAFFIVNPYFIYLVLSGNDSFSLLWNSSRVILNTINEYPLFSFLFGDIHAHVMGILPQTFLILLITVALSSWLKISGRGRILIVILTALGLALIPAVNSWDILIWVPMIIVSAICLIITSFRHDNIRNFPSALFGQVKTGILDARYLWFTSPAGASLLYLLAVPAISLAIISPFLLGIHTQGIMGIGLVHTPSAFPEFLLVHGFFLLAVFITLTSEIRRKPWIFLAGIPFLLSGYYSAGLVVVLLLFLLVRRNGISDLFTSGGLLILLFCEFIYLKDNMGDTYYRMNTVFKLYIGAWLLTGTGAALMIGKEIDHFAESRPEWINRVIKIIPALLILMCLCMPAYVVFTTHGPHTPTLDGWAWLSSAHPGDNEAVEFLRHFPGDNIMVEAVGNDYQYAGRISSATGLQTILGWQFHEYMWRGNQPSGWFGTRARDVKTMYENPEQTINLMKQYNASLLYVGSLEYETYNVSLPVNGLKILYNNGDVTIYQLDNSSITYSS